MGRSESSAKARYLFARSQAVIEVDFFQGEFEPIKPQGREAARLFKTVPKQSRKCYGADAELREQALQAHTKRIQRELKNRKRRKRKK